MFQKLTVIRAFSQYYTLRIIRLFTLIALILTITLLIVVGLLAYNFSPWWWLLAVPILAFLITFILIRSLIRYIALRVYATKLSKQEQAEIKAFIDKLSSLVDVRHIGPVMLALTSMKDLVLYRELRTIKTIIENSKTLSSDYINLESKFK